MDKKEFLLNVSCPELKLELNYNIGGKIVSLPIEGNGKGKIAVCEWFSISPIIIWYISIITIRKKIIHFESLNEMNLSVPDDPIIVYKASFDYVEMKGKTYAEVTSDTIDIFPNKLDIHLDNLFNGNKVLGRLKNNIVVDSCSKNYSS